MANPRGKNLHDQASRVKMLGFPLIRGKIKGSATAANHPNWDLGPGSLEPGTWDLGSGIWHLGPGARDLGLGEGGLRPGAKGLQAGAWGGQVQRIKQLATNLLTRSRKCSKWQQIC